MSTRDEDARLELERLADAVTRSLLEASDDELVEIMGGEAKVEVAAREVDEVIAKAIKTQRQLRLEAARAERQLRLTSLETKRPNIPTSPEARRDLFFATLRAQPELTAAYRNLDNFTEEDINNALLQMGELGLLGEDNS